MSRLTHRPNTTMRIHWDESEISLLRALFRSFKEHIDPKYKLPAHHAQWWQRVWLSDFARQAGDDEWGSVYWRDPKTDKGEMLTYLKMHDYVEDSVEIVYIQKWLQHAYPKDRDLTMISVDQARTAAHTFMGAQSKGTIVYTDSRLVGTFPKSPWEPDGEKFDVRQVLTDELGKHVGFALRNCLRREGEALKYWVAGSDNERLFIAVEHGGTKVLAAFHVDRQNVDSRNGQKYALLTSPLKAENASAREELMLPDCFQYDDVIWCAAESIYYGMTWKSTRHKQWLSKEAKRILNAEREYTHALTRALLFGERFGVGTQPLTGLYPHQIATMERLRRQAETVQVDLNSRPGVHIVETTWNPLGDFQSQSRLHRTGAHRPTIFIADEINLLSPNRVGGFRQGEFVATGARRSGRSTLYEWWRQCVVKAMGVPARLLVSQANNTPINEGKE